MKEIGLYIHIPFCKQKCYYCDFCSYADKNNLQKDYINSVLEEIKNIANKEKYILNTIYIGGGTPSILNFEYINQIFYEINKHFVLSKNIEITIEINPGTINEEKLKNYKSVGINRLSIGLQSANDKILKTIGRIHNYAEFEYAFDLARKIGFKNINVDLMIGLPSQSIKDVDITLEKIINKNPEHISVYSLIVEEGTPIEKMISENKIILPDDDTERLMYWNVREKLINYGYTHYEISNFAKKGYESKHNMDCWCQKEYIGIGAAAHSYLNKKRYSNTCNIEEYIKNIKQGNFKKNIEVHEVQNRISIMNEYMILGLRKINGINIKEFEKKFNENPKKIYADQLAKLKNAKLIDINNSSIKLSEKGIDFGNIVWEEFL